MPDDIFARFVAAIERQNENSAETRRENRLFWAVAFALWLLARHGFV